MTTPSPELNLPELTSSVTAALRALQERAQYQNEQRDLQPHLAEVLRALLQPQKDLEIVTSIGGKRKPSLVIFGTSFWPDLEIRLSADPQPLIGIEVKYIRPGQSASKAIAECLGQALLYKQRYRAVIAYILHDGNTNQKQIGEEKAFIAQLEEQGIHVIVKRRSRA